MIEINKENFESLIFRSNKGLVDHILANTQKQTEEANEENLKLERSRYYNRPNYLKA